MSLSRYPDYKHSGVDWLGEIPSHWKIERFKNVLDLRKITVGDTKGDYTLLSLTLQGVIARDMVNPKGKFPAEFDTYQVVEKDDLVFCLFDVEETPRAVGISPCTGMVTGAYTVGRAKVGTSAQYLYNFYLSRDQHKAFKMYYTGLRNVIRSETFNAIPCPVPPIDEQIGISNFLEKETAKIDMLVEQQEKLIELLKEKRQVVISRAVTRGIDPSIKMKDSGVEWLGEVPDHWKILKIKRLSAVQRGASPRPIDDPKYFDDEGEYGWVRISDVSSSNGVLRNTEQKLSVLGSSLSVKIEPKQLFISIAGTVGKPCVSAIKACIHDGFVYFPNLKINPWWLFRIFEAGVCYGGLGKLGTQLNLNTDTVGSISIGVPPDQEIESILNFIQITLEKFDGLISEAQKVIDLSLERRSSLISAAVTGQIDVRNYQLKEVA